MYREGIRRVVEQCDARNPCIFGSVVQGGDTGKRDLDLLADPISGKTALISFIRIQRAPIFNEDAAGGFESAPARLFGDFGLRQQAARGARATICRFDLTWAGNAPRVVRISGSLVPASRR